MRHELIEITLEPDVESSFAAFIKNIYPILYNITSGFEVHLALNQSLKKRSLPNYRSSNH